MRCEDCPSDLDEGLYERLRAWRMDRARELGQPAYCVFTDKTLLAIAEVRPEDESGLAVIPGVGARKLERFGADVLALVGGRELPDAADEAEDAESDAAADGPATGAAAGAVAGAAGEAGHGAGEAAEPETDAVFDEFWVR
jgi:DNA helicase-2/ATP-dependent DNA helicase PcrA